MVELARPAPHICGATGPSTLCSGLRLALHGTVTKEIIVVDHPRAWGQREPENDRESGGAGHQIADMVCVSKHFGCTQSCG